MGVAGGIKDCATLTARERTLAREKRGWVVVFDHMLACCWGERLPSSPWFSNSPW